MAGCSAGSTPAGPSGFMAGVSALPILIIDDQPADLKILADCLRDGGFETVHTAVGGQAGLAVLADAGTLGAAPVVVVVKIGMPAPDGYEVLAGIAAMDAVCRPLALAVTGDSSQAGLVSVLRAGASEFIIKPFDTVELLMRVRKLAEMKRQERELRHALTFQRLADEYRVLADNCVDVVAHYRGREIVWISTSVEIAFGWSREHWLGTGFLRHIHPDDTGAVLAALDEIAEGRSMAWRVRVAIAEGGYRWTEGRAKPSVNAAGDADGMIATLRIIDDQVEAERQRAEAQARYQLLFESAPDAVVIVGPDGTITGANAQTDQIFGYPREELIGAPVDMLVPQRFRGTHAAYRSGFLTDPAARPMGAGLDLWGLRRDGTEFPVAISLSPVRIGPNSEVLAAIRDVTAQHEAEQKLKAEKERFEAVVANAPAAISVCDLEHRYTMVNETFCQLFGQKSVGDIVGRTDDEILPPDVLQRSRCAEVRLLAGDSSNSSNGEESIQLGPEIITVMTQRFPLHDSAGLVTEVVTIRTDITLRKAAEQQAAERALWEERIRVAIDAGRLLVYSQPIVDVATNEKVAEELLVRLRAVELDEILPPSAFLPQCAQYGLMPVIDRYMTGRAIELARMGRHVSVNITGQTISDATAMSEILSALTAAGPDIANKIIFEVTETTALAAPGMARAFSLGVRDLGCRVALDDFGTGYGTFTELRQLSLDTLKIDQSFVRDILVDRDNQRLVNTIIFVARTYGLTTVAEGVETREVLEKLAELGADRAQGYFFDEPRPVV